VLTTIIVTVLCCFTKFVIFVSVIENLPMEMRERLTEMRETDLQVQSNVLVYLAQRFYKLL
jgi:hypothetical protein